MDLKTEGKFRYNGADLALMKKIANTDDPHLAVEEFIERALLELKDPNQLLEETRKVHSNG